MYSTVPYQTPSLSHEALVVVLREMINGSWVLKAIAAAELGMAGWARYIDVRQTGSCYRTLYGPSIFARWVNHPAAEPDLAQRLNARALARLTEVSCLGEPGFIDADDALWRDRCARSANDRPRLVTR